jgi:DNA-binding NarL/FixJ family response regulator
MVRWLTTDGRFSVVARHDDGARLVEAVDHDHPDVVVVDVELSGAGGGLVVLAAVREAHPATALVAVTDQDDDQAYAALRAGARSCYLWSDPVTPLATAVAGAARGEGLLTPGWAGRLVDEVGWLGREAGPLRAPELTPTELEVLRRVASGATPSAIAALHGVTEHMVNVHAGTAATKVFRHHDDARRLGLSPA